MEKGKNEYAISIGHCILNWKQRKIVFLCYKSKSNTFSVKCSYKIRLATVAKSKYGKLYTKRIPSTRANMPLNAPVAVHSACNESILVVKCSRHREINSQKMIKQRGKIGIFLIKQRGTTTRFGKTDKNMAIFIGKTDKKAYFRFGKADNL